MKKLITTIILWAGLWNAPSQAQCEEGAPGGGSYSYNPGDSTGTHCAIWEVECGEEVTFHPQAVIDSLVIMDNNSNFVVKNGFSTIYNNLVISYSDSMLMSELIPDLSLKTGLTFDIRNGIVYRGATDTDWVKLISIDQPLSIQVISNDSFNTSWGIDIKKASYISQTRKEKVVLCEGKEVFWISKSTYPNKVWNTPTGQQFGDSVRISIPGLYFWSHECGAGDKIEVESFELPSVITVKPISCTDSVELSVLTNGLVQWSNGENGNTIRIEQGAFSVTITDSYGNCPFVLDTTVWYPSTSIYIPNAVSPNGDGINDFLCVYAGIDTELKDFEFKVFDRWGELLFATTNPAGCWDGTFRGQEMPPGVYAFLFKNKDCEDKGLFTLLR